VLSLEDLAEEVVGEIDEGVPTAPKIIRTSETSARVAGTLRLDELGQAFEVDLEHEEVDSVSGLVMALVDRPPVVGDVVEYGQFRFTVSTVSGHGAKEVLVEFLG